jgi:hypothetical protein
LLCSYNFPWTPTKYIPFYGGADYHDYHHYVGGQSQSNFASVFTYCDFIYGTDKVNRILVTNYAILEVMITNIGMFSLMIRAIGFRRSFFGR